MLYWLSDGAKQFPIIYHLVVQDYRSNGGVHQKLPSPEILIEENNYDSRHLKPFNYDANLLQTFGILPGRELAAYRMEAEILLHQELDMTCRIVSTIEIDYYV